MLIRWARPEDRDGWMRLWLGFLQYYDMRLEPGVSDFTWQRLMDPSCPMKMRLAVDGPAREGKAPALEGQSLVGFAIHQSHPSSWVMGDDCYLEDLFVDPARRGQGIGRALITDLADHARSQGWKRLYWNTEISNAAARKLYDSFTPDDGHVRYRMRL